MNGDLTSSGDNNQGWKFNSLVCFDLETTGLPQYGGNVRITEFALVGIVRSHINSEIIHSLPRVLHKLVFNVYPQKTISLDSSLITDLWNDQLEYVKPWNIDTHQMLLSFLNLLPAPVCIVAHNGFKFDFPILKLHLREIEQVLPDHFIFMDSLPAFQKILRDDVSESSCVIEKMIEDMGSDNDILTRVAEEVEAKLSGELATKNAEVTPDPKIVPKNTNCHWKMKNGINSTNEISNPNKSKVRRCLFPTKKLPSFKLTDIYSHLHNQSSEGAHNAEGDAITLLKCILKIAPQFLNYADNNHKTFNSL